MSLNQKLNANNFQEIKQSEDNLYAKINDLYKHSKSTSNYDQVYQTLLSIVFDFLNEQDSSYECSNRLDFKSEIYDNVGFSTSFYFDGKNSQINLQDIILGGNIELPEITLTSKRVISPGVPESFFDFSIDLDKCTSYADVKNDLLSYKAFNIFIGENIFYYDDINKN